MTPEVTTSYQYVIDLKERLQTTCELAQKELAKSQTRYKRYYDRKARSRSYKVNDHVLILLPTDNNTLLLQWKGPFKVVEKVTVHDYKLDINGKFRTFHANMLKQYLSREQEYNGDNKVSTISAVGVVGCLDPTTGTEDRDLYFECDRVDADLSKAKMGDKLMESQKTEIIHMLQSLSDAFSDKAGKTNLIQHEIRLTTEKPVRSNMYPIPYTVGDAIKQEIEDMLDLKVIERSISAYAAPIVLVRKKDNSYRFCVDYRRLNQCTLFDPEPMVAPDDIFTQLNQDLYFTKIDLAKAIGKF